MEKSAEAVKRDFSDIVLPGGLQDHVRALAAVTANTRSHGAPFRHMLFYGPPGDSPPTPLNTILSWHVMSVCLFIFPQVKVPIPVLMSGFLECQTERMVFGGRFGD